MDQRLPQCYKWVDTNSRMDYWNGTLDWTTGELFSFSGQVSEFVFIFVQQCDVTWRTWQNQCMDSTFSVAQAPPPQYIVFRLVTISKCLATVDDCTNDNSCLLQCFHN